MSTSISRDGDISRLHPAIRDKVQAIRDTLHDEGHPFEVFEAFRTPDRQAHLFAQGRTRPGNKVTWVGPWRSIHQYGLAVDFVLCPGGKWSWDDSGANARSWTRMHEVARDHGMTPLFNSKGQLIEKPHIQIEGVSVSDLAAGRFPSGGDAVWSDHITALIHGWRGQPPAPPAPVGIGGPPGPSDADMAEMEAMAEAEMPSPAALPDRVSHDIQSAQGDARFQRMHAFVCRYEGGFVNDPRDNGGATNMGVTQGTLADWRGRPVTVEDVRTLSRGEADAILRTNYYLRCRCGELPDRVAMVIYNAAVLHGPKRAIQFLQRGFNSLGMTANGKPLEEDGILGPMTMTAAKKAHPGVLADAIMSLQEAHHRAHEDFGAFGKGWLNRLAALRDLVATLPEGEGLRPTVMTVSNSDRGRGLPLGLDLDLDLAALLPKLIETRGDKGKIARLVLAEVIRSRTGGSDGASGLLNSELLALALNRMTDDPAQMKPVGPDGKPPLTPVNAALGQTLGRALNGKKSVIGIVGMLLTVILPELGIAGQLGMFMADHGPALLTALATFTGWGFLGKIDKAIWSLKQDVA